MTWYIFRHCETLNNILKAKYKKENPNLYYNRSDYDTLLTVKGVNQAQSIGYRLSQLEEDFSEFELISSPLSRTKHTLQIVAEILGIENKNIQTENLLITKGWINYPRPTEQELIEKEKNMWIWTPKGCNESYKTEYERVLQFVEKYKNKENLIICGHNGTISVLIKILSGWSLEEIKEKRKSNDFKYNQNYFYSYNKENGLIRY